MAINSKNKKGEFTEINITPLTDIFLVLLIIMMVVAPSFQSNDNSLKMPKISSGANLEYNNVTISISKDNTFYLNGKEINSNDISNKLIDLKSKVEKKEVIVKADKEVKSKEIIKVMQSAQEAQYEKFIIAGEPLTSKSQKELAKNNKKSII